ncbi:hypothetical protein M2347_002689 [Chryseobacterium sp. H1D6B]|uniref:hypothetical protein n=1 Tax=Chryseobacterium sp. H1D6B TaxID=2940588 RepID=UPI0015C6EEC5|nr:hypothetical protein [Chryseobacterium sp. H1D6B]MDH6252962.1 hypothetical protein [Chryseobacterium sp. H1D6B]
MTINKILTGIPLLYLILILTSSTVTAQSGSVGIGTASPNLGAILDLTAADKGLLLTRISLTNTGTWGLTGTSTPGMTVYNTNAGITASISTNALSAGAYPPSVNGIGLYTWDGYGWVPQNSAAEVMKIPVPNYPPGSSGNGSGGSTATGVTTIPLNTPAFNTISGAVVTPATGAVFLPAGIYRIGTSLSVLITNPGTNYKSLTLMVATAPNGLGDVHASYYPISTNANNASTVNGNSVLRIGPAGGSIYFTVFVNNLAAGDTWAVATASPQSQFTIERIH